MIENIPTYVALIFVLTTIATLLLFIWIIRSSNKKTARQKSKPILFGLTIWLVIQAVLTLNNIYKTDTNVFPPKLMLFGILPTVLAIIWPFTTQIGREFLDSLPLKKLTYLNVVRIPVEIGLFCLFLYKAVPELMTFEGRNFDIFSGITAPFVAYFGLTKAKLNRQIILIWNFICLGLLINIVVNALFSAPSPIQKFAFEQPNIAILNFPFSWLPTFIVPIVLFGQLTSIRQLVKQKTDWQVSEKMLTANEGLPNGSRSAEMQ
ncbi:MAG: hypothetical protein ICV66_04530 [Chitinophagaceae bacterium]|nr:hypothetical protein [Chitinophagaceae bacterium]